jgi:hypothetical protein
VRKMYSDAAASSDSSASSIAPVAASLPATPQAPRRRVRSGSVERL